MHQQHQLKTTHITKKYKYCVAVVESIITKVFFVAAEANTAKNKR